MRKAALFVLFSLTLSLYAQNWIDSEDLEMTVFANWPPYYGLKTKNSDSVIFSKRFRYPVKYLTDLEYQGSYHAETNRVRGFLAQQDGHTLLFDLAGNEIMALDTFNFVKGMYGDIIVASYKHGSPEEKTGFLKLDGTWVAKPQYFSFSAREGDYMFTLNEERYQGVVSFKGKVLLEPQFDEIQVVHGLLYAQKGDLLEVYDEEGALIHSICKQEKDLQLYPEEFNTSDPETYRQLQTQKEEFFRQKKINLDQAREVFFGTTDLKAYEDKVFENSQRDFIPEERFVLLGAKPYWKMTETLKKYLPDTYGESISFIRTWWIDPFTGEVLKKEEKDGVRGM